MVRATMDAWHDRKISPVYQLLPNLEEPEWKRLRIGRCASSGSATTSGNSGSSWPRPRRIGDLLVLANEAPIAAFRADAWITAGRRFAGPGAHVRAGASASMASSAIRQNWISCARRGCACSGSLSPREPGHSLDRARAALSRRARDLPEGCGDVGAAGTRRQGRLERGVGGRAAPAEKRTRPLRGRAAARRHRELRERVRDRTRVTTTPGSTR